MNGSFKSINIIGRKNAVLSTLLKFASKIRDFIHKINRFQKNIPFMRQSTLSETTLLKPKCGKQTN